MVREYQEIFLEVAVRKGLVTTAVAEECRAAARRVGGNIVRFLRQHQYLTHEAAEEIRRDIERSGVRLRVGGYELLGRIGHGSTGTVYRARQMSLGRLVAVKLLAADLATDKRFLVRFYREAQLAARLAHPNVVQVYDVGEAQGVYYLAMEYVPGESLARRLARTHHLPPAEVVHIGKGMARALQHAETAGIVHRDIKPGNILLGQDGAVKLADLGLAKQVTLDDLTGARERRAVGTPSYISPEQAAGRQDADTRSDIYSLGATLYHAATGQPPFLAATTAELLQLHLEARPLPACQRNPAVPRWLSDIIDRMLAKSLQERYQCPAQVLAALEKEEPS